MDREDLGRSGRNETGQDAEQALRALLAEFRPGKRFIVTSHARPDGDAVGSALALAEILDQLGCEAEVVMADPVPFVYRTLPGVERIAQRPHAGHGGEPAVLLECDGIQRTGLQGLEGRRLLNIDHHASGRAFGAVNWIDEHACAVAAMVYQLAVAAGVKITPGMATCLYTAVLTDTGSFTFPGTGPEAFALAHELIGCGVDASRVAEDVYFTNRAAKVRLLGAALSRLRCEDEVAWSWVSSEDMASCDAEDEDCEGAVNYLIGIAGVHAAVFLREVDGGAEFRMSLRSKGGVDVSQVAAEFGGGGHRNAGGCTVSGPLDAAVERVVTRLRAGLR
jgi:phosphoesterase RecJ-like protein